MGRHFTFKPAPPPARRHRLTLDYLIIDGKPVEARLRSPGDGGHCVDGLTLARPKGDG